MPFRSKMNIDGHKVAITCDENNKNFLCEIITIYKHIVTFRATSYEEIIKNFQTTIRKYNLGETHFRERNEAERFESSLFRRSSFRQIFDSDTIENLRKSGLPNWGHPLYETIHCYENGVAENGGSKDSFQASLNTELGIYHALLHEPSWLNGLRKRLVSTSDDFSDSSSALAEIRAFGAFRNANIQLTPISASKNLTSKQKEPATDFEFPLDDKTIHIEVHTRLLDKSQREALLNQKHNTDISILPITPLGQVNEEKNDDGVSTNAISKICSVKQTEHQLDENKVNILWIDLQDDNTMTFSVDDAHAFQFFSYTASTPTDTGEFILQNLPYSGNIWHAFWGKKGNIIYENSLSIGLCKQKMHHDGRFVRESKLNFAIVALHNRLIVYENPRRSSVVPALLRRMFFFLPYMSHEHSLLEIADGYVDHHLALENESRLFYNYLMDQAIQDQEI